MNMIEFDNGSSITCLQCNSSKRSKRAEKQIKSMKEQMEYWQHNPDKWVEFVTGSKLHWYQKIWLKLIKR